MSACQARLCGAENRPGRWPNGWLRLAVANSGEPARWYCGIEHLLAAHAPDLAAAVVRDAEQVQRNQRRQQRLREGIARMLLAGRTVGDIVAATGEPPALVLQVRRRLLEQQDGAA